MQDFKSIERSGRCYVYICYVNDKPVYVGKGTNKRWQHCISGKSANFDLNKTYFEQGPDKMHVDIVEHDLDDYDAHKLEKYWIKVLVAEGHNLFNFMTPTLIEGIERLKLLQPSGLSDDMLEVPDWVTEHLQ